MTILWLNHYIIRLELPLYTTKIHYITFITQSQNRPSIKYWQKTIFKIGIGRYRHTYFGTLLVKCNRTYIKQLELNETEAIHSRIS